MKIGTPQSIQHTLSVRPAPYCALKLRNASEDVLLVS